MITIYHNPMWSKSRKSVEILKEKKIEFQTIEYLKKGLTRKELLNLSKKLNLRPKDFIRRKDKILSELGLEKELENDDKILDQKIS